MLYKILAGLIVVIHFVWILFMLVGFLFTLGVLLRRKFLNWTFFRTFHLSGVIYVTFLALSGNYCPLTILEKSLRERYQPGLSYPGSFLAHHLQRFIYPEVNPSVILIPLVFMTLLTAVVFIIFPPEKIKRGKR